MIIDINKNDELINNEAWNHSACLSIAEGCPGWDNEFPKGSPAMLAVQKLRKEYNDAISKIVLLEKYLWNSWKSPCFRENSTNLFPPCSIKDGEQPTANPLSPLTGI